MFDPMYNPVPSIHVAHEKGEAIYHFHPHYTDDRFRDAQTVFVLQNHKLKDGYINGAEYNYSDRIYEWYPTNKERQARDKAIETAPLNSALWVEIYLRELMDDPELEVVHILAGWNWTTGYDYRVYGYIPGKTK